MIVSVHKFLRRVFAVLVFGVVSCSSPRSDIQPELTKFAPQPWKPSYVAGLQVDLIHPIRLEWMSFARAGEMGEGVGVLAISYGTRDGFTFPARLWRIEDGKLVIFKNSTEEYERLTLLSLTSS